MKTRWLMVLTSEEWWDITGFEDSANSVTADEAHSYTVPNVADSGKSRKLFTWMIFYLFYLLCTKKCRPVAVYKWTNPSLPIQVSLLRLDSHKCTAKNQPHLWLNYCKFCSNALWALLIWFLCSRALLSHVDVATIISMHQARKIYCCIEKCLNNANTVFIKLSPSCFSAALRFNAIWGPHCHWQTCSVGVGTVCNNRYDN